MSSDPPSNGCYSYMDSEAKTNFNDSNTFHDRVLLIEGKKFFIQSGLLSVWSEFFRGLFNSDFKEKNQNEIKLDEMSSDEFETFLRVVYGEYLDIEEEHLELLTRLAHRFLAPKVIVVCKRFIYKNFDLLEKPMLLDIACRYDMQDVKKKTLEFIESHDDFRLIDPLLEVAFHHDLTNLEETLRQRDQQSYFPNKILKKNKNTDVGFSINMEELSTEFSRYKNQFFYGILTMSLESGGVSTLTVYGFNEDMSSVVVPGYIEFSHPHAFKRTVEHLLFTEAIQLAEISQPDGIVFKNADVDDAKKCWKALENKFPNVLLEISFTLVGLSDMWDHNIRMLGALLSEAAAKMTKEKPGELYIYVSKSNLTLSTTLLSMGYMGTPQSNKTPMFSFDFVGGWNLPTGYGTLFPIMLKKLLKDLKLFIILEMPCKNCIEWIFKHMSWTFDDTTSKLVKDYNREADEGAQLEDIHKYRMRHYNKFNTDDNTEVTYFFLKESAKRNAYGMLPMRGC